MRTVKVELFKYAELSDKAKQEARHWWFSCGDDWYWDSTKEDAEQIGVALTSCDIDRGQIDGTMDAESTAKAIIESHGESCATYGIAERFLKDLADLRLADDERAKKDEAEDTDALESLQNDFTSDILAEYLKAAKENLEYSQSDEYIEEGMEANDCEFDASGKRVTYGE